MSLFINLLLNQTVSAITTFFLAMCTHPEVQRAGQSELDRIVGNERLPTMSDRPSLPYVNAIVKEVMRWGPVVPGGMNSQEISDMFSLSLTWLRPERSPTSLGERRSCRFQFHSIPLFR